jgi:hypothetical protein
MAAADSDMEDPYARRFMEEEPQAAVIADVATNPASPPTVLEEAVGRINPIYVVAPIVDSDGSTYLQVAKGGVFSYYEFPWPMDDRLTDEKWRSMLADGTAPAPPEWTAAFLLDEIEYADLSRAVSEFQESVTAAYWWRDVVYLSGAESLADGMASEIASLAAGQRYMGHQLLASAFRSFDLQSPTLAVVTARETWQDTLYALGQYSPDFGDASFDERGPYLLDATYTLELMDAGQGPQWRVTGVVYAQQPPGFE